MGKRLKIGRNDNCPCGSVYKYKHCCEGKVPWEDILRTGSPEWKQYLSVRGRNIAFLNAIGEALQLDRWSGPIDLQDYKSAFTPDAVKKIHEAIVEIWPHNIDIASVLSRSKADVSGLYVGEYRTDLLLRAVARHSLYANKILLIDPFIHPYIVRDNFNPILNPEQFRTLTLRTVDTWFKLSPWIEAGLVEFIRPPSDFDRKLNWESYLIQKSKFEHNDELKRIAEESAEVMADEFKSRESFRMLLLSAPDEYILRTFRKLKLGSATYGEKEFLEYIHEERKRDIYYLDPVSGKRRNEFFVVTSGANYVIAKMTANITGSYLVTDIPVRWKEIELDRSENRVELKEWSALAKGFHNLKLNYLGKLDLDKALKLRKEGRLETLRSFLRRLWSSASTGNPFGESNVQSLADELEAKVREAEEEWKQIDRDLIKWVGAEAAAGITALRPVIESGGAEFLAGAIAVAGAANVVSSTLKRKGFPDKFPAGFFMKLRNAKS